MKKIIIEITINEDGSVFREIKKPEKYELVTPYELIGNLHCLINDVINQMVEIK